MADAPGLPHGQQSFTVRSWLDMLHKLEFELAEFVRTRQTDRGREPRGYRALNVAWTAWHIHDWLFEERMDAKDLHLEAFHPAFGGTLFTQRYAKERQTAFADALANKYPSLRICRTIATAAKHGKATHRPFPELITVPVTHLMGSDIELHAILFDVRIRTDNQTMDAARLFDQALANWYDFFTTIGWRQARP